MTAADLLWHGVVTTFWVSVLTIGVLALRKSVTERLGARAAMLLWMIPLARLLMPTLPRAVVAEPTVAATPQPPSEPPAAVVTDESLTFFPGVVADTPETVVMPTLYLEEHALVSAAPGAEVSSTAIELLPLMAVSSTELFSILALSLWGAGMIFAGALCWLRVRSWRATVVAEAQPIPPRLETMIERAAARAGVQPPFEVVVSAAAETPQLLGLRRPIVALPTDFLDRFSVDEQEMALMHEFVHLKRGDLIIMLVTEVALALQWFNPLVHRVRKAVRDDQEAACDEAVRSLGVCRQRYAALLVKAASHGRAVPALTLDHSLKERIILMTSPISSPAVRGIVAATAALGSVGVAAATASYTEVVIAPREARGAADPALTREETGRTAFAGGESGDASYWERYGTSSRDDHLYTVYHDQSNSDHGVDVAHKPRRVVTWGKDETAMVLLSDPFAEIIPPADLAMEMPQPPEPPAPQVEERRVEGGRWIFVPDEPDMSGFEEAMKEFEARVESWSARMQDFGARMEAAGEAVEELAERCARHQTLSEKPMILSEAISGGSDKVRAVCASGGMTRFRSAEMRGFLNEQRLSEAEKAYFQESIRSRG